MQGISGDQQVTKKIEQIQNNPNMPPEVKQRVIATIKGASGGLGSKKSGS